MTGSHIYHAKNHNDVIPVFIEVTNTAVSCEGVPLSAMQILIEIEHTVLLKGTYLLIQLLFYDIVVSPIALITRNYYYSELH